ncbi:hypothetical protein HCH_00822 [Hahella chejuensis KCTC 2396]|uniref:Uncharacterized protein n=1 Tax=Hahella chejuensis (strain KCTC 2396) TaxID=349521 RepID=Q2SNR0_HAHCH|nr:hypothetical protein HCH_00822 [Hahella chejuensis KCTC 2396]
MYSPCRTTDVQRQTKSELMVVDKESFQAGTLALVIRLIQMATDAGVIIEVALHQASALVGNVIFLEAHAQHSGFAMRGFFNGGLAEYHRPVDFTLNLELVVLRINLQRSLIGAGGVWRLADELIRADDKISEKVFGGFAAESGGG